LIRLVTLVDYECQCVYAIKLASCQWQ
jgi:hypothetical protein